MLGQQCCKRRRHVDDSLACLWSYELSPPETVDDADLIGFEIDVEPSQTKQLPNTKAGERGKGEQSFVIGNRVASWIASIDLPVLQEDQAPSS